MAASRNLNSNIRKLFNADLLKTHHKYVSSRWMNDYRVDPLYLITKNLTFNYNESANTVIVTSYYENQTINIINERSQSFSSGYNVSEMYCYYNGRRNSGKYLLNFRKPNTIYIDTREILQTLHCIGSSFYDVLSLILIEHLDLPKDTQISYERVINRAHSIFQCDFEPYIIINVDTLVNFKPAFDFVILMFPYSKKLALYGYSDMLNSNLSFLHDAEEYKTMIRNFYEKYIIPQTKRASKRNHFTIDYGLFERTVSYSNIDELVEGFNTLVREYYTLITVKDHLDNMIKNANITQYHCRTGESTHNIGFVMGNLLNYLHCTIRDHNNKHIANFTVNGKGDAIQFVEKASTMYMVKKDLKNFNQEIKDATNYIKELEKDLDHLTWQYNNELNSTKTYLMQRRFIDSFQKIHDRTISNSSVFTDLLSKGFPLSMIMITEGIKRDDVITDPYLIFFALIPENMTNKDRYNYHSADVFYGKRYEWIPIKLHHYKDPSIVSREKAIAILVDSFYNTDRVNMVIKYWSQETYINLQHRITYKKIECDIDPNDPDLEKTIESAIIEYFDHIQKDRSTLENFAGEIVDYYTNEIIDKKALTPGLAKLEAEISSKRDTIRYLKESKIKGTTEELLNNLTLSSTGYNMDRFITQVNYYCEGSQQLDVIPVGS